MGNPDNIPVMREMGIDPYEVSRVTNEVWLEVISSLITLPFRLVVKLFIIIFVR